MKVKELIEELTQFGLRYGLDKQVVMSVDPEGNSFSTLAHLDCLSTVDDEKGKVIGCCIWPFEEGFEYCEEAARHESKPLR